MRSTIDAADLAANPSLLKAIQAALVEEAAPEPVDPNHTPFGHVRLAPTGGGWICGLCGRAVVAVTFDQWRHA